MADTLFLFITVAAACNISIVYLNYICNKNHLKSPLTAPKRTKQNLWKYLSYERLLECVFTSLPSLSSLASLASLSCWGAFVNGLVVKERQGLVLWAADFGSNRSGAATVSEYGKIIRPFSPKVFFFLSYPLLCGHTFLLLLICNVLQINTLVNTQMKYWHLYHIHTAGHTLIMK